MKTEEPERSRCGKVMVEKMYQVCLLNQQQCTRSFWFPTLLTYAGLSVLFISFHTELLDSDVIGRNTNLGHSKNIAHGARVSFCVFRLLHIGFC